MHSFKDLKSLAPLYLAVFVAVLGFSLVAPFFPGYAMNLLAAAIVLGTLTIRDSRDRFDMQSKI
jgi:hypothetical protein